MITGIVFAAYWCIDGKSLTRRPPSNQIKFASLKTKFFFYFFGIQRPYVSGFNLCTTMVLLISNSINVHNFICEQWMESSLSQTF